MYSILTTTTMDNIKVYLKWHVLHRYMIFQISNTLILAQHCRLVVSAVCGRELCLPTVDKRCKVSTAKMEKMCYQCRFPFGRTSWSIFRGCLLQWKQYDVSLGIIWMHERQENCTTVGWCNRNSICCEFGWTDLDGRCNQTTCTGQTEGNH